MRAQTGRPRLLKGGRALPLEPVPLSDNDISEGQLQELLDQCPDLLPIEEIGAGWGPLVSLGREVPPTLVRWITSMSHQPVRSLS